jgi:predicted metal-dependent peptidase
VDRPDPELAGTTAGSEQALAASGPLLSSRPFDHTKLAAARLRAAGLQPFLAMALYALTPVPDDASPTFAVDERWRLFVNPAKLREWTVPQVAGVLLHEVSHVVRDHAGRARTAMVTTEPAARLWNLAADAEINDDLRAERIELPEHPVTPGLLGLPAHKVAEFYYARLAADPDPPALDLDCGSGSHGYAGDDRYGLTALPAGMSDVEALLLRRRIAEAIVQLPASQHGSVAGGWTRWAQAYLRPQLDWRRLLGAKIKSSTAAVAGSADYSYARPPRRRLPQVVLPSLRRPVPRVAIIVDTSGSVTDRHLRTAWTEVHGCVRALGIRRDMLTVYAADVNVHRITGGLTRQVALTGGGGTNMARAIGQVAALRPRPDLVVVITDGLTPWPPRPVPAVIVVLLPTRAEPPAPPAWAQVIRMTTES